MAKKQKFNPPYVGIETINGITILYNRNGDYSVIIKCTNTVLQYSGDIESYYEFHGFFTNVAKILGAGNIVQKHDIFCKKIFHKSIDEKGDFLNNSYFEHFNGREYIDVETYLIITGEIEKGSLFSYDKKKFDAFMRNIVKILDLFYNKGLKARLLNEKEIREYVKRFFAINFNKKTINFDNIIVKDEYLKIGQKNVQNISIVDVEEVNFPSRIKPFKELNLGIKFPTDILSFLANTPNVDCCIYNQVLIIPDQRLETNKLEAKKKKHKSMPDPANLLCVADIEKVFEDIAKENQLLVYAHYNIIISSTKELTKAVNYIEGNLFDSGITVSHQCTNQLELFECSMPGNAVNLKKYDRFLTTSDTAICLLYKERRQENEEVFYKTYFTDRNGLPIGIDLTGNQGEIKLTHNSNKFVLGPSGSGKSFYMNSVVRQHFLNNTDVVLVDTGHSYSGICKYYKGKYITYTEDKPITMNPFKVSLDEYNNEKKNFLKSLVLILWKGTKQEIEKKEDELIELALEMYYNFYFNPFKGFTNEERERLKNKLIIHYENSKSSNNKENDNYSERKIIIDKIENLQNFVERGTGGEKSKTLSNIDTIEMPSPEERKIQKIEKQLKTIEDKLKKIKVESLSFNTFYEFSQRIIPILCEINNMVIDLSDYLFSLEKFYKGGKLDKTLNEDFETSLFDEKLIVFEIDNIKDDPLLFPIVTLIIIDVFIQKMRMKKNSKALIIEEAWKALTSPVMADNILYLYKTARKFSGETTVVTQELDDIIGNEIVKNSIINNSDIICLLDQIKFKDSYDEIAKLLSLNEVERRKIFTINNLNNKEGRNRFNEVYIKRGSYGQVYGVEVSATEYFTYTTSRIEKDSVGYYHTLYKDFNTAISNYINDMKKSGLKQGEWIRQVWTVLGNYSENNLLSTIDLNGNMVEFIKKTYVKLNK